ncbi:hypothetical protein JKA74_14625 [Marivirga sp. S37H4]|uniref:Uncharacterized protein n=1 Tax=Marivirga aurantiaca TaxID=2802615 RepID=A0A935CCT1_9BACT|nr:hypothetical protein [Marivirga aurantiaca]MBK6266278.1 hypothetical protein [Marivirga aurantiaca]
MALFSLQELDIANDPYILLIKNRVMEKVNGLMGELEKEIHQLLQNEGLNLPEEINTLHGKISKGENYKHLPYMMLDYPAYFTKQDIFAFRSMFYWGHFISFTIHLQGKYNDRYGLRLIDEFSETEEVYFCVNSNPWEYIYHPNNYQLITELGKKRMIHHHKENGFIKLSICFPISSLPDAPQLINPFFKEIIQAIL